MKYIKIFILGFIWVNIAVSQELIDQTTFSADAYNINKVGYPSRICTDGRGNAVYVEHFQATNGRRMVNRYIQAVSPKKYEELWAKPITKEGQPTMNFKDIRRLDRSFLVFGTQEDPKTKSYKVVGQFFSLTGSEIGPLQNISNYETFDTKSKGYVDEYAISPDSTRFLWLGMNPDEDPKKRKHFASVWGGDGRYVWSQELQLPKTTERYVVRQALVDKRGNAYFLMTYEKYTNTVADTAKLPIIVKYDYKQKNYAEFPIVLNGSSIPAIELFLTIQNEMVAIGVSAKTSGNGILNGQKAYNTAIKWNEFFYKKFNIMEGMRLKQENSLEIPKSWVDKYKDGANFTQTKVIEKNGQLLWLLEEAYTQNKDGGIQFVRYDVGIVSIDLNEGKIQWATTFEKRQRDFNNDFLFSYTPVVVGEKLHCIYVTEKGAQGKLVATSVNLTDGETTTKELISNQESLYYFFPARSGLIDSKIVILMGVGNPTANEYKLIKLKF